MGDVRELFFSFSLDIIGLAIRMSGVLTMIGRRRTRWALVVAFCSVAWLMANVSRGQSAGYRQLKPLSDRTQLKDMQSKIKAMVAGKAALDQTVATDWYTKVIFATMTRPDLSRADRPLARQLIYKDLQSAAKDSPPMYAFLKALVLNGAKALIPPEANFHPVTRVNAMLLLGSLNEHEAITVGANQSPPKPLAAALPLMLDEVMNKDQVDAVRVAALVGILRHAEMTRAGMPIAAATRNQTISTCLSLVESTAPDGRSQDAHQWLQRRAIQVLEALGDPGDKGQVVQALAKIIEDDKQSLALRLTSSDAMGRLAITSDPGIDLPRTTKGLGTMIVLASREHVERMSDRILERDQNGGSFTGGVGGYGAGYGPPSGGVGGYPPSGSSSGYGPPRRGGTGYGSPPPSGYSAAPGSGYDGYGGTAAGDEEEDEPKEDPLLTEARRGLKADLNGIKAGIEGTRKIAPNDATLKDLQTRVENMLAKLDEEELQPVKLIEAFEERVAELEKAFGIEKKEKKNQPQNTRPGNGGAVPA